MGGTPHPPEPLAVEVVDSHCHLDLMDAPVEDVLSAAQAVGVRRVVTIGIDVPSSRWSADLAAAHPDVDAGVAIHPNEAPKIELEQALAAIDELAARPEVRAVGETGLDYYRTGQDGVAAQQESFRRHIELAKRHAKAMVIHDRDAHDDVLRILDEEGAPEHTVFHCYSGDAALARACAERGYVMSFAGNVTFKNAQNLRDAVAVAPLHLLLVETDAPFLAPVPWRGRPNSPYLVPTTLRAMAEAKGVPEDELATAIAATAARVFG